MAKMLDKVIKFSLYLLVFLLPLFFLPFSFEAFEFNKQYLLFFLVSLAFFAWLVKMVLVDKEIRFKRSPLDLFVLIFLFVAILSAVFSINKVSSLLGFYGRFSDGLIGLLSLGALYFLITNNITIENSKSQAPNNKQIPNPPIRKPSASNGAGKFQIPASKILRIFIWSLFFVVLFSYFSIFGFWAKLNTAVGGVLPQVIRQATFNPVAGSMEGLAVFLAAMVVLLTGIILAGREMGKLGKAGIYLLLLAALGLLMVINFNPAWLVISLGLLLFLVAALWKRIFREEINKLLLPILLVVLSFAFLFITAADVQKLVPGYYLPQERVLGQGISWQVGLSSAVENVKSGFLGSGIGTWQYGFAKFKPVEFNQTDFWQVRFDRAGSHISELLGTTGFLGLLSYLLLIGMFLLIYWFMLSPKSQFPVSSFQFPILMAFLALLVGQFVFYQNTALAFSFWLLLGLVVVSWHPPAGGPVKEKAISFKAFPELSLIFSVLLMIFGLTILATYFFGVRFYLADVNYRNYFMAGEGERLEKAAELNPYQSQYKIVLARHYLDKIITEGQKPAEQIDEVVLSNNIYSAITHAREAAELTPSRVVAWETLAVVYREIQAVATGATEWGIKSFERAIILEPANPALHTELGKLYLISGRTDAAKEKFSKAKELKPDYIDASIQMAFIHEYEGRPEEAIKQMEELVSFYPYNVEAIFQLGRFYLNDKRLDEAISQFELAITLFPNHSNSLYSLGVAYQKKGEKEKAVLAFEKVLELNPGNQDVIRKLEELKKIETEPGTEEEEE